MVRDFSPNEYLPKEVRLAGYSGDAADLPSEAFQEISTRSRPSPWTATMTAWSSCRRPHDDIEHDRATCTLVIRVRH